MGYNNKIDRILLIVIFLLFLFWGIILDENYFRFIAFITISLSQYYSSKILIKVFEVTKDDLERVKPFIIIGAIFLFFYNTYVSFFSFSFKQIHQICVSLFAQLLGL